MQLKRCPVFSGFSVNNIAQAKTFYVDIMELELLSDKMGLELKFGSCNRHFIYEKPNHIPADFTVLNFVVEDINAAVDELVDKGVIFEKYNDMPATQDERGILRGKAAGEGPDIAWFKDPAGNILSLLED